MSDLHHIWDRIENWLQEHAPALLAKLPASAGDEHIQKVEAVMERALPEDLKASLLRHNGTSSVRIDGWSFYTTAEMLSEREVMLAFFPDDEIWWSSSWLPLAYNMCSDLICVLLTDSGPERVGEIIRYNHHDHREWLAANFQDFLSTLADNLEAGEYHLRLLDGDPHLESEHLWLGVGRTPLRTPEAVHTFMENWRAAEALLHEAISEDLGDVEP